LGIGPNPQSPIPNPLNYMFKIYKENTIFLNKNKN